MSEEDMKKIKDKYPTFEDIKETDSKANIEKGILTLIDKLET